MNRFYCTICKKIKRVQKYPADIQNVHSDTPSNRLGTCRRHRSVLHSVSSIRRTQGTTKAVN